MEVFLGVRQYRDDVSVFGREPRVVGACYTHGADLLSFFGKK